MLRQRRWICRPDTLPAAAFEALVSREDVALPRKWLDPEHARDVVNEGHDVTMTPVQRGVDGKNVQVYKLEEDASRTIGARQRQTQCMRKVARLAWTAI